jgi:hypothetical protein
MPPKIIGTIQGWTREQVDGMLRRWAATTANPRFEIGGFLGAGAYAFVFEIKNSATGERFALKVSRDASTAVDLLRREARMCNLFAGNRALPVPKASSS